MKRNSTEHRNRPIKAVGEVCLSCQLHAISFRTKIICPSKTHNRRWSVILTLLSTVALAVTFHVSFMWCRYLLTYLKFKFGVRHSSGPILKQNDQQRCKTLHKIYLDPVDRAGIFTTMGVRKNVHSIWNFWLNGAIVRMLYGFSIFLTSEQPV